MGGWVGDERYSVVRRNPRSSSETCLRSEVKATMTGWSSHSKHVPPICRDRNEEALYNPSCHQTGDGAFVVTTSLLRYIFPFHSISRIVFRTNVTESVAGRSSA